MAYARGASGVIPASRYMDILALGIIVNLLAFHFITKPWYGLPDKIKNYFNFSTCLWKWSVIFGIGWIMITVTWPTIQLKSIQSIEQLKNTHEFIRTGKTSVLQNKPLMHIPYPNPEWLAGLLSNPQLRTILPHTLTIPSLFQSNQEHSTFVTNGFYPTTGNYQNEIVLGSYNHDGNQAVGRIESTAIEPKHSFIEVPIAGYLGEKGLTLQLVIKGQAKPIVITPLKLAKEGWISYYVRTPDKPFKLVAIDNRSDLWFAFAMPRSLGYLSFITILLLENGWILLLAGLSWLFIILCPPLNCEEHTRCELRAKSH